jgi:zinc finger FYVE domain-containing protein 26
VVLAAINVFAIDLQDPKTAEKFISKIVSVPNQIQAHISCGKLRGAYLLAVKNQLKSYVELIQKEAKRIEDKTTEELCDRYLQESIK